LSSVLFRLPEKVFELITSIHSEYVNENETRIGLN
jgi:hypothetical protein